MEGALQRREVEKRALYTVAAVGRVLEADGNLPCLTGDYTRVRAGKGQAASKPGAQPGPVRWATTATDAHAALTTDRASTDPRPGTARRLCTDTARGGQSRI